jgi:Cd2+/Zn2+-exporting ATPase
VPVDCKITEGSADIDTRAITGESVPLAVTVGDKILSGSININGVIKASVVEVYKNSTVAKILELTENVSSRKSTYESFIHRFALVYTPVVVVLALLLAVVPSVVLGNPIEWIRRALTFLVISCPCALVISVPLAFFAGLGRASASGILIKGSNFLETLAQADTIIFDKTGTLTKGEFFVTDVCPTGVEEEELLKICESAEIYSNHPVSLAIREEYKGELLRVENVCELAGKGILAESNEGQILAGNKRLMEEYDISYEPSCENGTVVYVAKNSKFLGSITVSDKIKDNAKDAMLQLKSVGIKKTVILTGDKKESADLVAAAVGADEFFAELLPQDKVAKTEQIMKESFGKVVFCGDGINDAPVMAMADVAVSMGQIGQDAAIEASDIVITDDNLEKLPRALRLAEKTVRVARANIAFSIGVKVAVLILGALGITSVWAAVFADVGVCVIAVLNSIKLLSKKFTKF